MKTSLYTALRVMLIPVIVWSCTSSNNNIAQDDVDDFQYHIAIDSTMTEIDKWIVVQYNDLITLMDSIEDVKRQGDGYDNVLTNCIEGSYNEMLSRVDYYDNVVDSALQAMLFDNVNNRFDEYNSVPVGGGNTTYTRIYIAPASAKFYRSGDNVDFNDFLSVEDEETDWNHTELDVDVFSYLQEVYGIVYNDSIGEYVVE